jgi:hypothetical protein
MYICLCIVRDGQAHNHIMFVKLQCWHLDGGRSGEGLSLALADRLQVELVPDAGSLQTSFYNMSSHLGVKSGSQC